MIFKLIKLIFKITFWLYLGFVIGCHALVCPNMVATIVFLIFTALIAILMIIVEIREFVCPKEEDHSLTGWGAM